MKRLRRNPEKFEVVDLFTSIARNQNYKINVPGDIEAFVEVVGNSLMAAKDNQNLLHGKRVEALFPHVVGALGRTSLIKQEDSGDILSSDPLIQPPDYRMILNNGEKFFVEVKNCHSPNIEYLYPIKKDYFNSLEKYAELNSLPLKIAIYYSRYNKWVLLSKEAFVEQKKKYVIDFLSSVAKSEMSLVGDRTIATTPDLRIEILCDPNETSEIDENGLAKFIIGDIKIYCAGKEVCDTTEKNIAFYLLRYGNWIEGESEAILDGEKLLGVGYTHYPESPTENQEFQFVGELSAMVSRGYTEHTVKGSSIISLDTKHDPSVFSVSIPESYKGSNLPLLQIELKPNYEFRANNGN